MKIKIILLLSISFFVKKASLSQDVEQIPDSFFNGFNPDESLTFDLESRSEEV